MLSYLVKCLTTYCDKHDKQPLFQSCCCKQLKNGQELKSALKLAKPDNKIVFLAGLYFAS
jgi:hypothetical protein